VFESGELRRIFENMSEEITGKWGKLYNSDRHNKQSPNIVEVIKLRKTR
jgi:hypothetical protein